MNLKFNAKSHVIKIAAILATVFTPVVNADLGNYVITKLNLGDQNIAINSTMALANSTTGVAKASFYSPTMGHLGWAHSSGWGYVSLKKGVPVKIEVTAIDDPTNFHPAIAVWLAAGKAPVANAEGKVIFESDYKPWEDLINLKVDSAVDSKQRSLKMLFVTNAVDRDGWETGDSVPLAFDNALVRRIPDGESGKVSVTFTPSVNGNYVFVVGGINPNSAAASMVNVQVSVTAN